MQINGERQSKNVLGGGDDIINRSFIITWLTQRISWPTSTTFLSQGLFVVGSLKIRRLSSFFALHMQVQSCRTNEHMNEMDTYFKWHHYHLIAYELIISKPTDALILEKNSLG